MMTLLYNENICFCNRKNKGSRKAPFEKSHIMISVFVLYKAEYCYHKGEKFRNDH